MVALQHQQQAQPPEAASQIKPELRVGFVLLNQFTLVPVAGLVDSLRFAADKIGRAHV